MLAVARVYLNNNKRKTIIPSENPLVSVINILYPQLINENPSSCLSLSVINIVHFKFNRLCYVSHQFQRSVLKRLCYVSHQIQMSVLNKLCLPAALCKCSSLVHQKISKFVLLIWFFQHLPQNLHSFSVTKCFFLLSHLFQEGVSQQSSESQKKFAQRLLLPRTMQDGYLLFKDLLYHAFVRLK